MCACSAEDRALTGVWTTPELLKAVEKGYDVQHIYEVYHFPETIQYNPETGEDGLFTQYIATFLKIKQEASGYPQWVKSEADKDKYVGDFFKHHGIHLDKDCIVENLALRSIAKLALNSLWGKFGQRQGLPLREFVYDGVTLVKRLTDPLMEIKDFHIMSDHCIMIDSKPRAEFVKPSASSNAFVAIFTTSLARLSLYDVLDKLGERALYFDTDSVVYTEGADDVPLHHGDNLGELTDELKNGDYITHFLAGGPKNYAYKTVQNKTCVKVKGLSLNYPACYQN